MNTQMPTMSMLDYFFSLERKQESLHLFDDLQISQCGTDYLKHRGQYPVLFMTFKGIQNDTWDLAFNAFQLVIQKEFQKHRYLLDSPELAPEEKQLSTYANISTDIIKSGLSF